MEWIHFVGRSYYTIPAYEKEAELYGVSRRVALNMLSGITWGDRIWLAQGDMKKKNRISPIVGSTVFGSFRVTQLGGLDPWNIDVLKEGFDLEEDMESPKNLVVKRNCGIYLIDKRYQTKASLAEIAQFLRDSTEQVSILLLQGRYESLQPRALLPDVTFRWGYRRFNGQDFLAAYNKIVKRRKRKSSKVVVLPGEFKDVENLEPVNAPEVKTIEGVLEYKQADPYHPLKISK